MSWSSSWWNPNISPALRSEIDFFKGALEPLGNGYARVGDGVQWLPMIIVATDDVAAAESDAQGLSRNKVPVSGVEAPGWQGAKRANTVRIQPMSNAARRDGSAPQTEDCSWTGPHLSIFSHKAMDDPEAAHWFRQWLVQEMNIMGDSARIKDFDDMLRKLYHMLPPEEVLRRTGLDIEDLLPALTPEQRLAGLSDGSSISPGDRWTPRRRSPAARSR